MAGGIALLNDSSDRGSPSVIAPGSKEPLIDSSSYKVVLVVSLLSLRQMTNTEDLGKSIFLILEPKLFSPLDVSGWGGIGIRL